MIRGLARRGLNAVRSVGNRLAYVSRHSDAPSVELESEQNVLLITVDCLRNDRLSRTGYDRATTPFLNDFESFTPAIAPAPWTFSSVPSILTGMYPHEHGAVYPDDSSRNQDLGNPPARVHEDVYTLAELLARNGYETRFDTAIETAAIPVHGRFKVMKRRHDADATALLSEMQTWWNSTSEPKFGYVQLGDLHEPLHEPETTQFGEIPDVDGIDRWRFEHGETDTAEFEAYRSARELLYDTLVRHVDAAIEETLDGLDGIDDTVVVVTSDHGEEFWEFQAFEERQFRDPRGISGVGHGHALVPPVLEVPIVTNITGIAETDGRASLVDVVPTVLRELGGGDDRSFDGIPLQSATREDPVLSQEIAYGPNQIGVTDRDDHLIYVPERDRSLLIDFETGEQIDDPERESELRGYVPGEKRSGDEAELSRDVEERLSDLGYAE